MTLWWHTLIELWAWYKPHEELTDRMRQPLGQHIRAAFRTPIAATPCAGTVWNIGFETSPARSQQKSAAYAHPGQTAGVTKLFSESAV